MKSYPDLILLTVLLGVFATTGCSLVSWRGHHVRELVARRGPPDQITDDGSGGKIYTYYKGRTWTDGQGMIFQQTHTSLRMSTGNVERRMFWINNEGIVYRVRLLDD